MSVPQFGKHLVNDFGFRKGLCHLNNGSYGTFPNQVRDAMYQYRSEIEQVPDQFMRIDYAEKLMAVRAEVANLVGADTLEIAFVQNATTGTNTILRSLDLGDRWGILHFRTVYPSCGNTVDFVVDHSHGRVFSHEIPLAYPCTDEEVLKVFEDALKAVKDIGLAIFDSIGSLPGIKMPWTELIQLCRKYNVLSLVDGAHGIGHIHLNLHDSDPDFFVSNCHKWLHCARPSAILYVPERNQHLIHSMPIGYGYISEKYKKSHGSVVPPAGVGKTPFIFEFEAHSTVDYTPFLAIKDALAYRRSVGGESAIIEYCTNLAQSGGKLVAEKLGTEVMPGAPTCMVNIRLP